MSESARFTKEIPLEDGKQVLDVEITVTLRPRAEGANFKAFIGLLNNHVPSKERRGWMQKAHGGQDSGLLERLSAEIRAAYPEVLEDRLTTRAARDPGPKLRTTGGGRATILEYIDTTVPEEDRPQLRADLEKTSDDPANLGELYSTILDLYGRGRR